MEQLEIGVTAVSKTTEEKYNKLMSQRREAVKRWQKRNKDKVVEYQKSYIKNNRDKAVKYATNYNNNNKDKYKEYQVLYRSSYFLRKLPFFTEDDNEEHVANPAN
jgi:hypothetical protein